MAIVTLGRPLEEISDTLEPIPEGQYVAKIASAELKQSSKGNDMIELVFEVTEGEYAGRKLWDYLVLTDNSLWKVKRYVSRLLGLESGNEFEVKEFEGIQCLVTVGIKEGRQGPGNEVRDVEPA